MRDFDYSRLPQELLNPEIMNMVSMIHEFKGKQDLYLEAHADVLSSLYEVAKIQSTDASNRIEGIFTADKRLRELVAETTTPKNRNEEEIVGYRDVLSTIHESYDSVDVRPSVILQLHRDLYRHTTSSVGGHWKIGDNAIVEVGTDGTQKTRFKPLTALETPSAMDSLCSTYNAAIVKGLYDPLLLVPIFVFDFTCIHPFNDGNGRMSRLLTLLLLYRSGHLVGKYISIEKGIEKSKDTYYEALQNSSAGWNTNENSYIPFVRYMLGIIIASYREFSQRVENLGSGKRSKAERISTLLEQSIGKVTKQDILAQCPDVSATTVERTLKNLLERGYIKKVGGGRSTGYVVVKE
jgi:Fic family protein